MKNSAYDLVDYDRSESSNYSFSRKMDVFIGSSIKCFNSHSQIEAERFYREKLEIRIGDLRRLK
jgi:hypothetical protein